MALDCLNWLNSTWIEKIRLSAKARSSFMATADQLWMFTFQDTSAMWTDPNRTKWMGEAVKVPDFRVSVNKGFEFLAIIGPYLYWQDADRAVQPLPAMDLSPEMFGDPNDPAVQQMYQQFAMINAQEQAQDKLRCQLLGRYLNYSQREQPYGGLVYQAHLAIIDAMVAGRGVLWPMTYSPPGSERTLTGLFWDSYKNFFVDPDCGDPTLSDANWICRRHIDPYWVVEDRFGYERGSLIKAASVASTANDGVKLATKKANQTFDLVVWYEIWSRGGLGFRMRGGEKLLNNPEAQALEDAVGDFAYICVCDGIDKPLNCPDMENYDDLPVEEVVQHFAWPFEAFKDNRWPVAVLDFYPEPGSAWPNAPLASALGEIIALNCLISAFTEMAYENRKQIIAYAQSLETKLREALDNSASITTIPINDLAGKRIDEVIGYLKRPEINYDVIKAIQMLEDMIARRTGLVDFMYAGAETQSRSAQDVKAKSEKAQIRPDKMAKDVAAWMSEAAILEAQLAQLFVRSQDIAPLLGTAMASLWDAMIAAEDPELAARQFRVTIAASDIRKPDKARETENLQTMSQFMLPALQAHALNSGDPSAFNAFIKSFGDAIQQDTSGWMTGPWVPEQNEDPEAARMMAEAEMIKVQSDAMKAQAEASKSGVEIQKAAAETEETLTSSDLNLAKIEEIEDKIAKGYYKPKPAARPVGGGTKK